ncbi:alkaline phosphatase [Zunongwangia sp. HGR-M22]|uniref:alkaline phosphatase n=1 Tax=Zunongwangia sp. HGR-M22 TaxID=3015168 RepID=UPI0022DE2E33|nr:alkaline phosphatase [Zunongwangia sp. HGR-M22]WBL26561.1 alkaline phosphatase [Zunongwangia sp. HGR-M22]
MKRRDFFKNSSLFAFGSLASQFHSDIWMNSKNNFQTKKAKNIIFMVSDGMSTGTLNMADRLLQISNGKGSHWLDLYREGKINRALMDTASASSLVTDSAAGSSSWGGGKRVPNGSLNVSANGEKHLPILQKFKSSGKKVGCVTTVPITHATPAGFSVMQKDRGDQEAIALKYLDLEFDVMMGGGNDYFSSSKRADGKDVYASFKQKDFTIFRNRKDLLASKSDQKILGVFADGGLPYALDRSNDKELEESTPTLAEMSKHAIKHLSKNNDEGFVLQIEAGKVDWAAHANDAGGLLYDQIAFDEAIKEVIDFAEKDRETLVIITTDHGNANPGLIKSHDVDKNFSYLQNFTHTNDWLLQQIKMKANSFSSIREMIANANGDKTITDEEAKILLNFYNKNNGGLYNTGNLPYGPLAEMQKKYTSIGWISMDHSGDYVELAAFGPGSDELKPFVKNYELHQFMLQSAEVEDNF